MAEVKAPHHRDNNENLEASAGLWTISARLRINTEGRNHRCLFGTP